jgi:hypothetical protein
MSSVYLELAESHSQVIDIEKRRFDYNLKKC